MKQKTSRCIAYHMISIIAGCYRCQALAWTIPMHRHMPFRPIATSCFSLRPRSSSTTNIDRDALLPMDVVVFSPSLDDEKKCLGAIQEDGRVAPLSVWTDEPAFASSLEFVVDEVDLPGYDFETVVIQTIIPQDALSYGSRQVGGGKGPVNPHGEESELLYYVEQDLLEDIELQVRPHLEIL